MSIRSLALVVLAAAALPALAHDPAAHRRAQPVPAECAAFEGKDPATLDLKNPAVKAEHDKCVAARKKAKEAADAAAKNEHDH